MTLYRFIFRSCCLFLWLQITMQASAKTIDFSQIIVGDEVTTYLEVEETKQVAQNQISRSNLNAQDKQKQLSQVEQTVVENLVQAMLLLNRAKQLKLTVNDQQIEQRMNQLSEKNPALLEQIQQQNEDTEEIREKIAQEILKEQVLVREVNASVQVTPADALELCLQESNFQKKLNLYQILLRTTSLEKASNVRKQILLQVNQGQNFSDISKQFSDAPNVQKDGGLIPNLRQGQLLPALDQVAFTLQKNELSQPIQTQYGYHFLYVENIIKRTDAECEVLTKGTSNHYYFQAFRTKQQQFMKEQYFPKLRREFDISCFRLKTMGQKCLPLKKE